MKTLPIRNFINTPLQRADVERALTRNRFNGFSYPAKTVETVTVPETAVSTQLKLGVNERCPSLHIKARELSGFRCLIAAMGLAALAVMSAVAFEGRINAVM